MVQFTISCLKCGENTNYVDEDKLVEALKNHPPGHNPRVKARSISMKQEEMDKLLIRIMDKARKK